MRITIRAMCQKRNHLTEQILHCRSELSKICPAVLVQSIRAKIQETNSKLFNHLNQIKAQKLETLITLITKLPCYPHRPSSTVPLETFILYS